MLIKVCLLLLSVGVYASYPGDWAKYPTAEDFIAEMESIYPPELLPQFKAKHPVVAHMVHYFFNSILSHFVHSDPVKFWSEYNQDDFNRIKMDALFYEYLTQFAKRETKPKFFNPLERSKRSHEDIVVDRIGKYLDNLSAAEVSTDKSETTLEESESEVHIHRPHIKCTDIYPVYGVPGKDFPNYCEIPDTSFTCADRLVPGIYADTETRCQVFHACWPRRTDSYICPVGSTFNEALLTCDFWYNSDCNSTSHSLDHPPLAKGETLRNAEPTTLPDDEMGTTTEIPYASIREMDISEYDGECRFLKSEPLHMIFKPSDCRTKHLKLFTVHSTDEKFDTKRFERLIENILIKNLELLGFVIKSDESGKRWSAQRPDMIIEWPTPELASKIVKIVDEAITEKPTDELEIYEKRYDSLKDILIPNARLLKYVVRAALLGRQGFATPKLVAEVMKLVDETTTEKSTDIDDKRYEGLIKDVLMPNVRLLEYVMRMAQLGRQGYATQKVVAEVMKLVDETTTEKSTDELEVDDKRYEGLIKDVLIPNVRLLEYVMRMAQLGRQGYATQKVVSEVMKVVDESLNNADIDTTSEEQIYASTTGLPLDDQKRPSQRANSKFMGMSEFQAASEERVRQPRSVKESTLIEPSKPSEDSKKRVFDTVNTSLNLGGRVISDGILPLVEKIVLGSHSKKYKS